jgi:hypothetical protein
MNADRLCVNRTRLAARCFALEDRNGRELAVAVAKASYTVADGVHVSFAANPRIRELDAPWWSDDDSSIRYPSDRIDEKPGTDVLLVGSVRPPDGADVDRIDVTLRISTAAAVRLEKIVRVYGRHVWHRGATGIVPGPAARLAETPLTYELAFGGRDPSRPEDIDQRNPVGTGHAHARGSLVGTPAPRLESPAAPLGSSRPAPAGFGPIASNWEPRRSRFGTCDDGWRKTRAPLPPADFDPRYNSCAPDDQWLADPLDGDEVVEVLGPRPAWRLRLPRYAPTFTAVAADEPLVLATHLDTLLIDLDQGTVELTWRASHRLGRRHRLQAIEVTTAAVLPASVLVPPRDPWRAPALEG